MHEARAPSDAYAGQRRDRELFLPRRAGRPGRATYHATKHGVIGLTKSAAMDYAALGIRINAVCPGVIDTPMSSDMIENQPAAMREVMRDQPIGGPGRPARSQPPLCGC